MRIERRATASERSQRFTLQSQSVRKYFSRTRLQAPSRRTCISSSERKGMSIWLSAGSRSAFGDGCKTLFSEKGGQLYRHRAAKDEIEDSSGVRQTDHYEHPQKHFGRAFALQKDSGQDKQDIDEQQNEFYQKNAILSSVSQRI